VKLIRKSLSGLSQLTRKLRLVHSVAAGVVAEVEVLEEVGEITEGGVAASQTEPVAVVIQTVVVTVDHRTVVVRYDTFRSDLTSLVAQISSLFRMVVLTVVVAAVVGLVGGKFRIAMSYARYLQAISNSKSCIRPVLIFPRLIPLHSPTSVSSPCSSYLVVVSRSSRSSHTLPFL
jgi:hypothetical protein